MYEINSKVKFEYTLGVKFLILDKKYVCFCDSFFFFFFLLKAILPCRQTNQV
jgi:hypothetical protein